jgi:Family of unknown function (DUF6082)
LEIVWRDAIAAGAGRWCTGKAAAMSGVAMTTQRDHRAAAGVGTPILRWIIFAPAVAVIILMLGLGVVFLLEMTGTPDSWAGRANIGDSFGAINAIVSGLALTALIVTLWLQSRELTLQRVELAMQRESLNQSRVELYRNAEANLRMLHLELTKMSIDDPSLAAVWPPLALGAPHEKERQFLYANLIYQHQWLSLRISDYTETQVQNTLRNLFTSSLMREYWRAASKARTSLVPGTAEYLFAETADSICGEYEDLLAAERLSGPSPRQQPSAQRWERLNSDAPKAGSEAL